MNNHIVRQLVLEAKKYKSFIAQRTHSIQASLSYEQRTSKASEHQDATPSPIFLTMAQSFSMTLDQIKQEYII